MIKRKKRKGSADKIWDKIKLEDEAASYGRQVESAGGSKTWTQGTSFFWDHEIHNLLKLAGYELVSNSRQEEEIVGDKIKVTPASITVMTQDFIKKQLIKDKMKSVV